MEKSQNKSLKNDTLFFAEESKDPSPSRESGKYFKLLIVDDENETHVMTKLVLADYVYKGVGLKFLSAFSAKEAKIVIKENPDIACCLLDVVMESEDFKIQIDLDALLKDYPEIIKESARGIEQISSAVSDMKTLLQ